MKELTAKKMSSIINFEFINFATSLKSIWNLKDKGVILIIEHRKNIHVHAMIVNSLVFSPLRVGCFNLW